MVQRSIIILHGSESFICFKSISFVTNMGQTMGDTPVRKTCRVPDFMELKFGDWDEDSRESGSK